MRHIYNVKKSLSAITTILLLALLPTVGKAQYCIPTSGCTSGDFINNFSTSGAVTNITNNASGCNANANAYIYYSTMTVTAVQNTTFNVSMQSGSSWGQGFRIYVDWNIDGDFSDPGEDVYNSVTSGTGVFTGVISVPSSATPGTTRMRVRCNYASLPTDPCAMQTFGETEDYNFQINAMVPTPMVYQSSTTTQTVTSNLQPNTLNAQIIGIQVVTLGNTTPFDVTSFTINSTGSTNFANDVTNVKVYYTGTSGVFATTILFGSATNLSSPVTGTQALTTGTNYFWVTYDVSATATIGNLLDAQCTSITMNGAGGTQTPSVTSPAGNRMINYCVPTYSFGTGAGDYLSNVQLGSISNLTGAAPSPFYTYFNPSTSSTTTTLMQTQTYTITLTPGTYSSNDLAAWIDYNQDGLFSSTELLGQIMNMAATPATASFTFTVPANAVIGTTRLRVREADQGATSLDPCMSYTYGETEDYNITMIAMPQYDAGVQSLSQPMNDNCHGLNETVEVIVRNYGADTIDFSLNNMIVNASAAGPNPVTFAPVTINTGTLLPGATMPVTITTTYNMLNAGAYTFNASTTLTGDGLASNDNMPATVRNNDKPTVIASANTTICQNDSTPLNVTATTYGYGNQSLILSNANPVNIVDNNITGTNITVASSTFTASDLLWVKIDSLTHTRTGQLSLTLVAPNGTFIDLSSLNGAFGDNYINTVFVPSATASITTGTAPFTGNFLPEQSFSLLGAGPAQGTWKLRVNDNGFGDTGMLWKWTLALPTPNGIVSYSWSPSTGLSSDTIANPMASPLTNTTYFITATDVNGCSNVDTVTINVNPLPVVALGADTGICVGGSIVLDAGPGAILYTWSDNSTNQTLTVNAPGTYFVEVMDGNICFNRDTIDIQVFNPVVNLGNDTAICQNSMLVLDAGTGFANYTWSNLSTSQQINVTTANTYGVAVTDMNGCPAGDTIVVAVNALPVVNLGNDTTFCYVSPLMLNAGPGYSYLWNDSTMSQTLPVSSTGNYYVTITDANGCQDADTISIIANPAPVVNLGLNIVQCGGSVLLNAGNTGSSYLWSNNAVTQFTTVTTSGTYYVDVTSSSGCTESDTVQVTIYPNPIISLGEDTIICAGSTIMLNGGAGYAAYNWSYNSFTANTQIITVSPGVTTNYSLIVTDMNGCTSAPSSVTVFVEQAPQAAFSTSVTNGVDVIFTNQTSPTLNPTYTWNFGDSSPLDNNVNTSHTYTSNGTYMITLIVNSTCGSDTIQEALVITGVGIDEAGSGNAIGIYPNPNDGIFNLSIEGAGNIDLTIEVMDIQGKIVYSENENNIPGEYLKQLNLTGIAKGLYYLRLNTGTEIRMEKIVVQ